MAEKENERERTELYEREMKHEPHRETPPETAGREAGKEPREAEKEAESGSRRSAEEIRIVSEMIEGRD